ncbi:MAG: serine/threonine-protein phosphatase [Clostridiales bacterium]|nr:serine/threonine-protein phosphatase [Clostridiales bacterium]
MLLRSAVVCGPGHLRDENQDNFYLNGIYRRSPCAKEISRADECSIDSALYAVADGMGGEKHGDLASLQAVQSMSEITQTANSQNLIQYLVEKNNELCNLMNNYSGVRIGSTFVGLHIHDSLATLINIGDSRAYLFRDGLLSQLSRDHTVVQQMVDMQIISPEESRFHHHKHKLTQHLGIFPEEMIIEPFVVEVDIHATDLFLLCSDGLTDMLDNTAIQRILSKHGSPEKLAEELFQKAMKSGGKDNITVLLVSIEEEGREE